MYDAGLWRKEKDWIHGILFYSALHYIDYGRFDVGSLWTFARSILHADQFLSLDLGRSCRLSDTR